MLIVVAVVVFVVVDVIVPGRYCVCHAVRINTLLAASIAIFAATVVLPLQKLLLLLIFFLRTLSNIFATYWYFNCHF